MPFTFKRLKLFKRLKPSFCLLDFSLKPVLFFLITMKLHILGTGTAIPRIERGSSAYLVAAPGVNVLIDAGPSVVRRLLETGYEVDDIDVLVLTHFHVDHTADLSTFFFACNYGRVPRTKPLIIIGGKGIAGFYRGLQAVYPWIRPKTYDLEIKRLVNGSLKLGGITVVTAPVNHNPESIAVRLEGGRSVTFSGDTGRSPNLIRLADRTDVLVAECSFPERKVKGHLNLETLEKIVQKAKPKRVILTHLYPDWEEYRGILHAPYLLGEDGMEIKL